MFCKAPPQPGIDLLKELEGLKLQAYLDDKGIPTIAYGHTKGVKIGDVCDFEQAEAWLIEDCAWAWAAIQNKVEVPLMQSQAGALLSFVYNLGEPQFDESSLLKLLNFAKYSAVPLEMMKWVYETRGGERVIDQGLLNRRRKEATLWNAPAAA